MKQDGRSGDRRPPVRLALILALTTALGGCIVVGPDVEKPTVSLPMKWSGGAAVKPSRPPELSQWDLRLDGDRTLMTYEFDAKADRTGIPSLLTALRDAGIAFKDLDTRQSSLEDIFVRLIHEQRQETAE